VSVAQILRATSEPLALPASPAPAAALASGNTFFSGKKSLSTAVGGGRLLDIEVPTQEQDEWCWCAVAIGVRQFYETTFHLRQCQVAGAVLGRNACANPSQANEQARPETALRHLNVFDRHVSSSLKFEDVVDEIDAGRPLVARVQFLNNGLHHVVVIRGYRKSMGTELLVDDPAKDAKDGTVSYSAMLTGYRYWGEWTDTYFTRRLTK
jgi:hypothetical protein